MSVPLISWVWAARWPNLPLTDFECTPRSYSRFFYLIHKVSPAPKISAPVFVLQIPVPTKGRLGASTLGRPHKLCHIHVQRDTCEKIDVVRAHLSLDNFHSHFFAQLFLWPRSHLFPYCFLNHFSPVLWCEHHMVFTTVTRMRCVFNFISPPP